MALLKSYTFLTKKTVFYSVTVGANTKKEAKDFDEKMEFCTVVVSVAHRIIETDNQLREAVQSANDFYENNPEACND